MKKPRSTQSEETTQFLGYLRDHPASTAMAESIAELIAVRRAAATRRARRTLRMIPVPDNGDPRIRVAS